MDFTVLLGLICEVNHEMHLEVVLRMIPYRMISTPNIFVASQPPEQQLISTPTHVPIFLGHYLIKQLQLLNFQIQLSVCGAYQVCVVVGRVVLYVGCVGRGYQPHSGLERDTGMYFR